MIALALDTSTVSGSVALVKQDQTLGELRFERDQRKDTLFRSIQKLMVETGTPIETITMIAVGVGPGSFTGIRAGLAAAAGLALPRSIPIKTVNSYDALAMTITPSIPADCPQLCVLGDARREEIYYAIYDRQGRPVRPCQITELELLADEIHAPLWFVSSEIDRFADSLRACFGGFASVHLQPVFPSAAAVGLLGWQRYRADDHQGDRRLEPIYLREAQYRKSEGP